MQQRLKSLGLPVFFKSQGASTAEPFAVIGTNDSTPISAQSGPLIENATVLIDIFMPIRSRTDAEEMKSKATRTLGRCVVSSQMTTDNTIGREVYMIKMRVSDILQ